MPRAELAVADTLERRTRMDQREIDIEEDGFDQAAGALEAPYGPAIVTAAREESNCSRAAE